MDRNYTCKLLFENCMDCILHNCCVCNVHGINGPGNLLHKRIIHMALHGYKNQHKANRLVVSIKNEY